MAPASPISPTTTLLRPSVVVSRSDRFGAAGSVPYSSKGNGVVMGKSGVIHWRTVEQPSQPPTPPSCSDCATKTQAVGGGPPTQSASRMWRSSNGNMRIDTLSTSIITSPALQKAIMLDHLKKEAVVLPMPPAQA